MFEDLVKKIEDIQKKVDAVSILCLDGINIDGAHHKQWYLAEVLRILDYQAYKKISHYVDLGTAP